MTVDDLFRFQRVSDPQISPDGTQVVYVVGTITDPGMARQVIDAGAKFVVSPVFRPLHRYGAGPSGEFPGAEELHRHWASIPIYPSLRRDEMAAEPMMSETQRSGML
jgi:dTDP-4-amino-4,6-dideoxygalactose transaminase